MRISAFTLKNLRLPAILLAAFAVRVWGLGFGMPLPECRPDELTIIQLALGFLTGDPNPHFFNYPTLYPYMISGLYWIYWALGRIAGHLPALQDWILVAGQNPLPLFLIDRGVAALMGTATVYCVYVLAKRLWDEKTALLSALFLSLAYLHVRDSHFGVTDVPMAFWVCCSLLGLALAQKTQALKHYLWAGVLAGLAMSTKYNAVLLLVPMAIIQFYNLGALDSSRKFGLSARVRIILAGIGIGLGIFLIAAGFWVTPSWLDARHFLKLTPDKITFIETGRKLAKLGGVMLLALSCTLLRWPAFQRYCDQRLLGFAVALGAGFLIGSPFAIMDIKAFASGFLYEMVHLDQGHMNIRMEIGWWYHLQNSLPLGLGYLAFFAAIGGGLLMLWQETRKAAWVLSFPLVYYLLIGKGYTVFLRYMVPLLPFAALLAAYFSRSAWQFLAQRLETRMLWARVASGLLLLALLAEPVYNVIQFNRYLSQKDNRVIAREWFEKTYPPQFSVYQTGFEAGHLFLRSYPNDWLHLDLIFGPAAAYPLIKYDEDKNAFSSKDQPANEPECIVVCEYPLKHLNTVAPGILRLLASEYSLVKTFTALQPGSSHFFDQLDAFYLPFSGWQGVVRPGPNIYVYQKKSLTMAGR